MKKLTLQQQAEKFKAYRKAYYLKHKANNN